ncbi:GNAT family N-acetyltransferase [Oligoflexia bacterium]|nr:GNAT family N-acetyltransferase [Oligoflexia bacterium]
MQKRGFGGYPERTLIPDHVFDLAAEDCGVLFGAWEGLQLIGYVLAFYSLEAINKIPSTAKPVLVVHQLVVDESARGKGVGFELMHKLKSLALARGLDSIRWFSDPMLTDNSALYVRKLGARGVSFSFDQYGALEGKRFGTLPTHRIRFFWDLQNPGTGFVCPAPSCQLICAATAEDTPEIDWNAVASNAPTKIVAIPTNYPELKEQHTTLASLWQNCFFDVAKKLFEQRYAILDFERKAESNLAQYLFVLKEDG